MVDFFKELNRDLRFNGTLSSMSTKQTHPSRQMLSEFQFKYMTGQTPSQAKIITGILLTFMRNQKYFGLLLNSDN